MTLGEKQELFSKLFAELLDWCHNNGYGVRIGEVFRPEYTQKHYVETGRSKTMMSRHRDKLAADLFFTKDGEYISNEGDKIKPIGEKWESLHPACRWGGNFRTFYDSPHFELNL